VRHHAKPSFAGSELSAEVNSSQALTGTAALAAWAFAATGLLAVVLGTLVLLASTAAPALAADCANEIRRQEQGELALKLPDCRAYEMVSPGAYPQQWSTGTSRGSRASIDGDSVAFFEFYPANHATNSSLYYLAERGPGGWSAEPSAPQMSPGDDYMYQCDPMLFYSEDFSKGVLQSGYHRWEEEFQKGKCKTHEAVLDPREHREYRELFLHDLAADTYELLSVYPETSPPSNNQFQAASPDFETVVFSAYDAKITPDDPAGVNDYVASDGAVRPLGYLPDGTLYDGPGEVNARLVASNLYDWGSGGGERSSVEGSGDQGDWNLRRPVSEDGSKIYFYAGGNLYVRLNPGEPQSAVVAGVCTEPAKACTVQVDESQGPDPSGGSQMYFASRDGSKAFFTSSKKLTPDSTAEPGKEDLYEFDLATGTLTDLTANPGEPADVKNVTWVDEDGDDVFFVAPAALAPGAQPGNCLDRTAPNAFCNLYVSHEGELTFIAALPLADAGPVTGPWGWGSSTADLSRLTLGIEQMVSSPNGEYFAFPTTANLTGFDSGEKLELYLYNTVTKQIECVSCPEIGGFTEGVWIFSVANEDGAQTYGPPRRVNNRGQVFFETATPLHPTDTGSGIDVYKYEDGQQQLLSGGKGDNIARFLDATPNGDSAFFLTAEPLLASDVDGATSIYGVRVSGGFPEPPPLPGCEIEACRGQGSSGAAPPGAGTSSFKGAGNQKQLHKRDCRTLSKQALALSKQAKALRRKANRAADAEGAAELRRQAAKRAAKGKALSRKAKDCRRKNRRAGK
jgi:hypothetical protein